MLNVICQICTVKEWWQLQRGGGITSQGTEYSEWLSCGLVIEIVFALQDPIPCLVSTQRNEKGFQILHLIQGIEVNTDGITKLIFFTN